MLLFSQLISNLLDRSITAVSLRYPYDKPNTEHSAQGYHESSSAYNAARDLSTVSATVQHWSNNLCTSSMSILYQYLFNFVENQPHCVIAGSAVTVSLGVVTFRRVCRRSIAAFLSPHFCYFSRLTTCPFLHLSHRKFRGPSQNSLQRIRYRTMHLRHSIEYWETPHINSSATRTVHNHTMPHIRVRNGSNPCCSRHSILLTTADFAHLCSLHILQAKGHYRSTFLSCRKSQVRRRLSCKCTSKPGDYLAPATLDLPTPTLNNHGFYDGF